jgi:hypothetical protein
VVEEDRVLVQDGGSFSWAWQHLGERAVADKFLKVLGDG